MEDSWIAVVLSLVFLTSTTEAEDNSEPFWGYLFITLFFSPIALLIFIYMLIKPVKKPKSFNFLLLFSITATFIILFNPL